MPVLAFLFLVVPIIEIYVIIKVGGLIGALPTVGIMFLTAVSGAYLAQSQGRAVFRRFNQSLGSGKMPGRELSDGAMIVFGGALLVSPGFLTDLLGLSLLLPPTRAAYRRAIAGAVKRTPAGAPVFIWTNRPDRFRRGEQPDGGAGPATGGWDASGGFDPPPGDSPFGSRPSPPPRPRRSYDVEGTAREVSSEPPEIDSGNA